MYELSAILKTHAMISLGLKQKFSFSYFHENLCALFRETSLHKVTKILGETQFGKNFQIFNEFSRLAKTKKSLFVSTPDFIYAPQRSSCP
jgi:hypothetical protein